MKKIISFVVKELNLNATKEFWLANLPSKLENDEYIRAVNILTRKNNETNLKTIKEVYNRLKSKPLSRKETKYSKLGKSGQIKQEVLDRHLKFIVGIFESEKKRQENLEKKSLQLISQTGIIVSLISFSVGTLYTKIVELNAISFYSIIILFCLSLLFLFLTIYFAIKSLQLKLYARPSHKIITDNTALDENKFIYEEIAGRYNNINNNVELNNNKSENITKSFRFFFGSITTIIIFSISTGAFLISNEFKNRKNLDQTYKVEITNQVDSRKIIQKLDTLHTDLKKIEKKEKPNN